MFQLVIWNAGTVVYKYFILQDVSDCALGFVKNVLKIIETKVVKDI